MLLDPADGPMFKSYILKLRPVGEPNLSKEFCILTGRVSVERLDNAIAFAIIYIQLVSMHCTPHLSTLIYGVCNKLMSITFYCQVTEISMSMRRTSSDQSTHALSAQAGVTRSLQDLLTIGSNIRNVDVSVTSLHTFDSLDIEAKAARRDEPSEPPRSTRRRSDEDTSTDEVWTQKCQELNTLPNGPTYIKLDRDQQLDRDQLGASLYRILGDHLRIENNPLFAYLHMRPPNPSVFVGAGAVLESQTFTQHRHHQPLHVIRLWGFSSMTRVAGNIITLYEHAAMYISRKLHAAGVETTTPIYIQYDGDHAIEKESLKFSHSIMAPFVAHVLKTVSGYQNIFLIICKIGAEEDKGELVKQFCTPSRDKQYWFHTGFPLDGVRPDSHCYPWHFHTFNGVALLVNQTWHGTNSSSEQVCMDMTNKFLIGSARRDQADQSSFLQEDKVHWHCICMDGSINVGALERLKYPGEPQNDRVFDHVFRSFCKEE